MRIEALFEAFASERGLELKRVHYAEDEPDQLMIGLAGRNGTFVGMAVCLEAERLFMFYASLGIEVPEERVAELLPFLMELNFKLKTGAFYIDPGSRVLTYRVSQYLTGGDEDCAELLRFLVTYAARAADGYYPVMMEALAKTGTGAQ